MPNIRLVIEYDGSRFHGWQFQPGLRTIEGELERVLETVLREKIHPIFASGRTDAGVHARAQVFNFFTQQSPDLLRLSHSISNILRGDLSVLSAEVVSDDFNSRYDATSKQYSYTILNRPSPPVLDYGKVWHIGTPLDLELMNREAATLIGEHDFTSFQGAGCHAKTAEKTIFECDLARRGDLVVFRVVGSGFLKHMVRNIVGTLVCLSRGTLELNSVAEILAARNRRFAGETAPAHGLCLDWVSYAPLNHRGLA